MEAAYAKKPIHRVNNATFNAWAKEVGLRPVVVNDAAPWHMYDEVESVTGYKVRIDFWPHLLKACVNGVTYDDGLRGLNKALDAAATLS